jgi:hypothetical protein
MIRDNEAFRSYNVVFNCQAEKWENLKRSHHHALNSMLLINLLLLYFYENLVFGEIWNCFFKTRELWNRFFFVVKLDPYPSPPPPPPFPSTNILYI